MFSVGGGGGGTASTESATRWSPSRCTTTWTTSPTCRVASWSAVANTVTVPSSLRGDRASVVPLPGWPSTNEPAVVSIDCTAPNRSLRPSPLSSSSPFSSILSATQPAPVWCAQTSTSSPSLTCASCSAVTENVYGVPPSSPLSTVIDSAPGVSTNPVTWPSTSTGQLAVQWPCPASSFTITFTSPASVIATVTATRCPARKPTSVTVTLPTLS